MRRSRGGRDVRHRSHHRGRPKAVCRCELHATPQYGYGTLSHGRGPEPKGKLAQEGANPPRGTHTLCCCHAERAHVCQTRAHGLSVLMRVVRVCVGASSTPRPNTDTAPSHMGGAQSRGASSRKRVLILRGGLIPYDVATLSGHTWIRRKPMRRGKRCTVYPPRGLLGIQCRPSEAPHPIRNVHIVHNAVFQYYYI